MGRPKENKIHADSQVARLLTAWFAESNVTQAEVAKAIGMLRPNIVAMSHKVAANCRFDTLIKWPKRWERPLFSDDHSAGRVLPGNS